MEIVFENVRYKDFKDLSFTIKHKTINGISGCNLEDVLKLMLGNEEYLGNIYFGNVLMKSNTVDDYKNMISVVPRDLSSYVFLDTVEEYIAFNIKYKKIKVKDEKKTVIKLLDKLGLDSSYLDKKLSLLSSGEQKLMAVVVALLTNPKVLILEEVFANFDLNFEKKLMRFFNYLIDNKNMTIILISKDSDMLYKNTKHVILLGKESVISCGNTDKIYRDVDLLIKNNIEVPDIVMFTNKVIKNKNIKLSYHKDIRDLIKDVYKNV